LAAAKTGVTSIVIVARAVEQLMMMRLDEISRIDLGVPHQFLSNNNTIQILHGGSKIEKN